MKSCPDLAIEILSPENTIEEIHNKIVEYFENRSRLEAEYGTVIFL